jgi:hypothetical protein
MKEHITFIETTYDSLRAPLGYIKNKIEYITGKSITNNLPQIEYKKD